MSTNLEDLFCPYCSIGLDYNQMKQGKCNNCGHEFEVYHVLPVNDTKDHRAIYCCWCVPETHIEGLNFVVTHNSFDGREGVEWANELLKN